MPEHSPNKSPSPETAPLALQPTSHEQVALDALLARISGNRGDAPVDVTPQELRVLTMLASCASERPGEAISNTRTVWGPSRELLCPDSEAAQTWGLYSLQIRQQTGARTTVYLQRQTTIPEENAVFDKARFETLPLCGAEDCGVKYRSLLLQPGAEISFAAEILESHCVGFSRPGAPIASGHTLSNRRNAPALKEYGHEVKGLRALLDGTRSLWGPDQLVLTNEANRVAIPSTLDVSSQGGAHYSLRMQITGSANRDFVSLKNTTQNAACYLYIEAAKEPTS
jgi:hypothetical protein